MRFAYADPPYPGQSAKHYGDHPDFDGEVDHRALILDLTLYYDAVALHTSSVALAEILPLCPSEARVLAWVKPFAAFKRNVKVAYAWEPVIVWGGRSAEPNRVEGLLMRDYIAEPITMQRGLTGAKPERVCVWIFEILGLLPSDELVDLFPGTGGVTEAWRAWSAQTRLELA